jgi:acyl dehydratase
MPAISKVTTGDRLEVLAIPITRTLIVAGALATRDYQVIHHDTDAARARGLRDIIMNIYTTEGLVARFVASWAGPGAAIKRISLQLGVPNYPGDTMRLTGVVASMADGTAEVAVTGVNALGEHVSANVAVVLGN